MASGGVNDAHTVNDSSSTNEVGNGVDRELELDFTPKEPHHCWKQLQSCEEFVGAKRSKHTMVAWDDRVYVFGGDNGKKMLNDFLVSHVRDSSWARVVYTGQPPPPRYHHSAVVYQNSMFIFGGYTNSNSNLHNNNDLYEYRFTTSQWIDWSEKITGSLPPARSAHGAVVYDDKLWIFAGYDGHTRLNDMWAIDLTSPSPQWTQIDQSGDRPPTCCNFPLAVVGDSMYMFSGQSGARITNNMYQFKFTEKYWIRIPTEHLLKNDTTPPLRRYGHSMVAYKGHLYVFGGLCDGILDNEVHCFNVESCNWFIVQPVEGSQIPTGRLFHTAAVCGDCMYIFGGTIEPMANRSGELYRFKFSSFPICTLVNDFAQLLDTMPLCDVHFIVGKESKCVQAHTVVMAARSPFFRRKILEAYQESKGDQSDHPTNPPFLPDKPVQVVIQEVSLETFRHAIYYMYTDRLLHTTQDHSHDGSKSTTQVLLMMELYKFALLLETRRLELLCMQYLEASVNEDNVLLVLENASELNLARLKDYCMRFTVRESNFRKVIMTKAFETIDKSLMVQIIRGQQLRSRPTSPERDLSDEANPPSTLQDDLRMFLLSDTGRPFADIILKVGEEAILAHKPVLAARCSYFEALFRSFMPANLQIDIAFGKVVPSQQVFQSFLKYVYYGDANMPPEDALYIFSAPNFFGFSNSRLHASCKAIIEQNVCLENVVSLLEVSDLISLNEMKDHCLKLIAIHFPLLVHQPDFRNLSKPLLLDVLEVLAQSRT